MSRRPALFFLICSIFLMISNAASAKEDTPVAQAARFFGNSKKECATVLIYGKTVLRIYSSSEAGVPAYDRAEIIAKKINDLFENGTGLGSIEPSMIGNIAVGTVKNMPVFSIEPGDMAETSMPSLLLAYDWSNRIRRAFDAPLLSQDVIDEIVKLERMRGVKVEIRKKRLGSDQAPMGSGQVGAEVLINDQVVMRMYGTEAGESAYDRARDAAQNLEESIMSGKGGEDVTAAALSGNRFSIKIGSNILSLIGKEEMLINKTKGWELAQEWVNRMREALNASPLSPDSIKTKLTQFGKASWYGGFFHGRRTSSGERYNMYDYTAAHKQLPFGTEVLVTRLDNYKSVVVRVTDRGPFVAGRIIDLSRSAAEALGLIRSGVAKVRIDVIEKPQKKNEELPRDEN